MKIDSQANRLLQWIVWNYRWPVWIPNRGKAQTHSHTASYPRQAVDYGDPSVRAANKPTNNEPDEFDQLERDIELDYDENMNEDVKPPADTIPEPIPEGPNTTDNRPRTHHRNGTANNASAT